MYDAIIVGARCGGSPTAMLLARKGYRVLLVDKASFPSDTLSTHYIHQPGVSRLSRWGLLDKVAATGCPPVHEMILDFGPVALRGTPPPHDGAADAFAPRRTVLDKILLDAAIEAGAEFREHFTVEELLRSHALLAVRLETGRTHQIRVHLAAIDLPVSGDPVYGVAEDLGLERQFLHAARLAFPHPMSGDPVEADSPLPPDLETALARARAE